MYIFFCRTEKGSMKRTIVGTFSLGTGREVQKIAPAKALFSVIFWDKDE